MPARNERHEALLIISEAVILVGECRPLKDTRSINEVEPVIL